MPGPNESEKIALAQAATLLRYAAENIPDIDSKISLVIAQSSEAAANDKWTPQTSEAFWWTYGKLCALVKPVTIECLSAVNPTTVKRTRLLPFLGTGTGSLATRTSGGFLLLMGFLLLLVVPLQLYTSTLANLAKDIDQASTEISNKANKLAALDYSLNQVASDPSSTDQQAKAGEVYAKSADLLTAAASLGSRVELLKRWRLMGVKCSTKPKATPDRKCLSVPDPSALDALSLHGEPRWHAAANYAQKWANRVRGVGSREFIAGTLVGSVLLSFFLPVLFGAVGAVAYVIRTISGQITTTTFSPTSPIRHLLRVALGALLGVVVGLFSDKTQELSLPPLAIAFLAGYGVEAVFLMFDGLINRFKEPAPPSVPSTVPAK